MPMSSGSFYEFREKMLRAGTKPQPPTGAAAITVTELTGKIDRVLKEGIPTTLIVKGEMSNLRSNAASGHWYFTLKDAGACIPCVMWKSDAARQKFEVRDGMELLATGKVGVFAQQGKYQLYVTALQPLGQGALELAFKQLKAKLEAQGLFDPTRKKALPPYPRRVALVTSRATAALQDMLKVLRRYPWLQLSLCHVPVQGNGAAGRIAEAISYLNQSRAVPSPVVQSDDLAFSQPGCPQPGVNRAEQFRAGDNPALKDHNFDVILLARGGGSLEDLWEFNEEAIARAIAASRIPVVTGIGHEVDTSIADLVADHHAHTPTEAAQTIVQGWNRVPELLDASTLRLRRGIRKMLSDARQQLAGIERHEVFRRPLDRINQLRQWLDDRQRALQLHAGDRLRWQHKRLEDLGRQLEQHRPELLVARFRHRLAGVEKALAERMRGRTRALQDRLQRAIARLGEAHPKHQIRLGAQRVNAIDAGLSRAVMADLRQRSARVAALAAQLQALGPENVLRRGYSLTTLKKGGAVVRSPDQLKPGDRLVTRLADGVVESKVEDAKQLALFE